MCVCVCVCKLYALQKFCYCDQHSRKQNNNFKLMCFSWSACVGLTESKVDSFTRPYLSPTCYRLLSYTLDDLGFNSLQEQQIFLFSQNVQTDSVSHPASCSMNTWALSSGIKWPERETDHSFPPSAEVKNDLYLCFPLMTLWRAQGQLHLCVTPHSASHLKNVPLDFEFRCGFTIFW